jgi:protein disulfide-isomerase A6
LNDSNFDSHILNNDELYLVEFFAPWCGHCKNLAPHWEQAAMELDGVAKLAAVDATISQQLAAKYDVKGYPTIKIFKPHSNGVATDYTGGRTADDIVSYVKSIASKYAKSRDVHQIVNDDEFQKEANSASILLVTFLPHILDTTAKQRNAHIDVLKDTAKKFASKPIAYGWIEGTTQPTLEKALNIPLGSYPAIAAINLKKNVATNFVGSYTEDALSRFITRLMSGKEQTYPIDTTIQPLESTSKWDGKDATPSTDTSDDYDIDIADIIAATSKDDL